MMISFPRQIRMTVAVRCLLLALRSTLVLPSEGSLWISLSCTEYKEVKSTPSSRQIAVVLYYPPPASPGAQV